MRLCFQVLPAHIDETAIHESPHQLTRGLAVEKVNHVLQQLGSKQESWVLGADTVIVHKGNILGKPADRRQAREMLTALADSTHQVITGLALYSPTQNRVDYLSEQTDVTFAPLSIREIQWYLDCGEWQDAAGGYRIQERGACLVTSINGSYSNVVGLPIRRLYELLHKTGFPY
jgi:septum formation protein